MKCTTCGATLPDQARFCSTCGVAVPADAAPPRTEGTDTDRSPAGAAADGKRSASAIFWLAVLWLALIGWVASVAIPLLAGHDAKADTSLVAILVVLYFIARLHRARRAWLYPLVGFVCLLVLYVAGGYIRASHANKASQDELIGALSNLDPSLATAMRAAESNKAAAALIMKKAMLRAARRAPDAALIQFRDASLSLLAPESADYVSRCAAMARGGGTSISYSSTEQRAFAHELALFFNAAAKHANPQPLDQERAGSVLSPIYAKVYPSAIVDDPSKFSAMSESEQCRMFEAQTKAMRALPANDAALVLRYLMLASPDSTLPEQ